MNYNFMGADYTNEYGTQDIADNKVVSVLAYIPLLFWIPLVAGNSPFGRFHANQGLLFLLFGVALTIASAVLEVVIGWIPFIGAIVTGLVSLAIFVVEIGLMVYGMVNAGQGKAKELIGIGCLPRLIK